MTAKTTLEAYIHINAEWNDSRITRITQIPTHVMDRLKLLELGQTSKLLPIKNEFPAQMNFENRALTWFEIEQIEDITLNYNKEIECSM
jgi:hypothetical protein